MDRWKTTISNQVTIEDSAKAQSVAKAFDCKVPNTSKFSINVDLPSPATDGWKIGLIVGSSGSGKTTIAKKLFGKNFFRRKSFTWDSRQSILNGFPSEMSIGEITNLLTSVGLTTVPSWFRPYKVLSNGEKDRVFIARVIAEAVVQKLDYVAIDEFTSVVDRTVAKISSKAIASLIRKRPIRVILLSCHFDIIDWLSPDWAFETDTESLTWLKKKVPQYHSNYSRYRWQVGRCSVNIII